MSRRPAAFLLAVLLTVLPIAGCSSHHKAHKPRFALAKLNQTLLTVDELPVTGYTLRRTPGQNESATVVAGADYSRAGRLVFAISVAESISQKTACQALRLDRADNGGLTHVTSTALPFGVDGLLTHGTDAATGTAEVDASYVQGASLIQVQVLQPAVLSDALITEIARRQNYKYIAIVK